MIVPHSGMTRVDYIDHTPFFDLNACEQTPFIGMTETLVNGPEDMAGPAVVINLVPESITNTGEVRCHRPNVGHTQVVIAGDKIAMRQDIGKGLGEWVAVGAAGGESSSVDTSNLADKASLNALVKRVEALEKKSVQS